MKCQKSKTKVFAGQQRNETGNLRLPQLQVKDNVYEIITNLILKASESQTVIRGTMSQ